MNTHSHLPSPARVAFGARVWAAALLATASLGLFASAQTTNIAIPNFSFESQVGTPGINFGTNVLIDSWTKPPNPGYPEDENFNWIQTAGNFNGTIANTPNPYTNLLGNQAAYLLSLPGAAIFQDNISADWSTGLNGLDATFETGSSYQFTLGLYGKAMVNNFSSLMLSFYYRDGLNAQIPIGIPALITFNTTTFNPAGPFTLQDYSATLPEVQAGDAWAGKNIGLLITNVSATGDGYWDMDNARLTQTVPEPSSIGLLLIGLAGLGARFRRRAQAA